jgi:hypothetical protein
MTKSESSAGQISDDAASWQVSASLAAEAVFHHITAPQKGIQAAHPIEVDSTKMRKQRTNREPKSDKFSLYEARQGALRTTDNHPSMPATCQCPLFLTKI